MQNRIDSASMARQTVVSRTVASVGVTTGISASNSQTAKTGFPWRAKMRDLARYLDECFLNIIPVRRM